jgi:hypothetical protein
VLTNNLKVKLFNQVSLRAKQISSIIHRHHNQIIRVASAVLISYKSKFKREEDHHKNHKEEENKFNDVIK